ncbi:MAG: SDR family oxidoreductase [Hyphomonadaceae bacterium]|nr:SDR family oxidoreductase [Hyphomonadaceae bacterium]
MEKLFEGQVAFVTGAGGGIGRATAISFAREGAQVALCDLKPELVQETLNIIESEGGKAVGEAFNIADDAKVEAFVDSIVARFGRLDAALNNAGISLEDLGTPWGETDIFDKTMNINARSVMICMRAELKHMAKAGRGAIVNTASVAGMSGLSGPGYCGSKHAVVGLTRSAAMAYAAQGVRVNCVCPGAIRTPMTAALESNPQGAAFIAQMHPMGRMGEAQEIADAVIFLCSSKASFITGHPLAVDGGFLAR